MLALATTHALGAINGHFNGPLDVADAPARVERMEARITREKKTKIKFRWKKEGKNRNI